MAKTPENNLTLFIRIFYEKNFYFEGASELYADFEAERANVKNCCGGEAKLVQKYNQILKEKWHELYS